MPDHTTAALASPLHLAPTLPKPASTTSGLAAPDTELLQVVVETPRSSRNKYSYDEAQRTFVLKKTLPAGMVFPLDFGFLPQTTGGDGDALDVLLFLEEPCFPGCAIPARLLGVMEVEQTHNGQTERNDRLLAAADTALLFSHLHTVDDLPAPWRHEVDTFFSTYHALQGAAHHTLAWSGPDRARQLITEARTRFRNQESS